MIAEGNRIETLLQPLQRLSRVRTPIDEVRPRRRGGRAPVRNSAPAKPARGCESTRGRHRPRSRARACWARRARRQARRLDPPADPATGDDPRIAATRNRAGRGNMATPGLHDRNAGDDKIRTPVPARDVGADSVSQTHLGQIEFEPTLGRPVRERRPEAMGNGRDLHIGQHLRECIVVQKTAVHRRKHEITVTRAMPDLFQIRVIRAPRAARPAPQWRAARSAPFSPSCAPPGPSSGAHPSQPPTTARLSPRWCVQR